MEAFFFNVLPLLACSDSVPFFPVCRSAHLSQNWPGLNRFFMSFLGVMCYFTLDRGVELLNPREFLAKLL